MCGPCQAFPLSQAFAVQEQRTRSQLIVVLLSYLAALVVTRGYSASKRIFSHFKNMRRLQRIACCNGVGRARSLSANAKPPASNEVAPDISYVDILDRLWNGTQANSSTDAVMENALPWFDTTFLAVRDACGIDSWALLLLCGGAVRLLTLYASLCGERAGARMQCALPELKPAHEQFQRIYYSESSRQLDIQQAATVLKAIRKSTFKQYRTSNARTLAGLLGAPLVMQGLYATSKLCNQVHADVGSSSFLWCTALCVPDPFFVLPAACCALTLLNFELTLSRRSDMNSGMMGNLVKGGRLLCLCAIPAVGQMQAGVLLYWLGMSTVGLLQPLLVRLKSFREWFGIPDPPAVQGGDGGDLVQRRLSLQVPYLSHMFEVGSEAGLSTPPEQTLTPPAAPKRHRSTGAPVFHKVIHSGSVRERAAPIAEAPEEVEAPLPSMGAKGVAFAAKPKGWRQANDNVGDEELLPERFRK